MSALADPGMRIVIPADVAPISASDFVVLSRFVIANGMGAEVKAAFCARPHLVNNAAGYSRMEAISPLDRPEEIWRSRQSRRP